MKLCNCGKEIPQARIQLGYKTCINCSTEERWSAIQVVYHKTGHETQVVKDPDVAAEFYAKSQRTGFGTLKGMTGSYRRHAAGAASTAPKLKNAAVAQVPAPVVISRKPMPLNFEGVGLSVMDALESLGIEPALQIIEHALQEHRLLSRQATQLREIVHLISEKKSVMEVDCV